MAISRYTGSENLLLSNIRFATYRSYSPGTISGAPSSSKRPGADISAFPANKLSWLRYPAKIRSFQEQVLLAQGSEAIDY